MPQSYYHVLAATSCYAGNRGTTWLRRSCNVRQRGPNVIKWGRTETVFFLRTWILNVYKIQVRFPAKYNDVATRDRQQRGDITDDITHLLHTWKFYLRFQRSLLLPNRRVWSVNRSIGGQNAVTIINLKVPTARFALNLYLSCCLLVKK